MFFAEVMRAWQTQIDALGQLNFLADPAGNVRGNGDCWIALGAKVTSGPPARMPNASMFEVAKALKLADKDLSAQLSTPRSRRFALVVSPLFEHESAFKL